MFFVVHATGVKNGGRSVTVQARHLQSATGSSMPIQSMCMQTVKMQFAMRLMSVCNRRSMRRDDANASASADAFLGVNINAVCVLKFSFNAISFWGFGVHLVRLVYVNTNACMYELFNEKVQNYDYGLDRGNRHMEMSGSVRNNISNVDSRNSSIGNRKSCVKPPAKLSSAI